MYYYNESLGNEYSFFKSSEMPARDNSHLRYTSDLQRYQGRHDEEFSLEKVP